MKTATIYRTSKVAMNKQELIRQITNKVVESVPEIMELKFGCNIVVAGIANDNPGCEKDIVVDSRIENECVRTGYFGNVPINDIQEILGRDIALEDILQMKDTPKSLGSTREENAMRLYDFIDKYWQLSKPLHEQSEECLEFIWEIIK